MGQTVEIGVGRERYGSVGHCRTAGSREFESHVLTFIPHQRIGRRSQIVRGLVDGERCVDLLPVHGDFHGLGTGGQSHQPGYRELPASIRLHRRGQVVETGVGRERYGNVGYCRTVGGREFESHVLTFIPHQRIGRCGQIVRGRRDVERFFRRALVVYRYFNLLLPGEDGGQARDLELPAGVGGLRVRRQAGKAFALREQYAQTGYGLAVARQGKGDVMLFMLVQSCLVGGQHIGRRRDGELRLGRGLAVHFGRERLFPGENGGQTRYGEIPAAVRGICSRQSREGGAGIEGYACPGHG